MTPFPERLYPRISSVWFQHLFLFQFRTDYLIAQASVRVSRSLIYSVWSFTDNLSRWVILDLSRMSKLRVYISVPRTTLVAISLLFHFPRGRCAACRSGSGHV